jgi:hypothetical protein
MRVLRWIGFGVLGLLLLLGSALAYTSQPPYTLPAYTPQAAKELAPPAPQRPDERTVIIFVFDGFAPSTLRAADAPNLARMAREGAHTHDMMPVFPSLSD